MYWINCYIPIKVRMTGRPSDADLDRLAETLVRTVTARIAFAERAVTGQQDGRVSSAQVVYADWESTKYDPLSERYTLASYQGPPTKASVKVQTSRPTALGKALKIEIYIADKIVRVLLEGDQPPLYFEAPELSE